MDERGRPARRLLALGALALVIVVAWWAGPKPRAPETLAVETVHPPLDAASSSTEARTARRQETGGAVADRAVAPTLDVTRGRARTPLANYLASSIYPPTSRPIAPGDRSLVDYDARHERPQRVPGLDGREVLLTADRAWLVDDDAALLVLLTTFHHGEAEIPERATVTLSTPDRAPVAVPMASLARADAPLARAAADMLAARGVVAREALVARIEPGTLHLDQPTTLRLDAEIPLGTTAVRRHLLVPYTPGDAVPARFVEGAEDAIEDGSLVVRVGVDVREPGRYLIDANLHANDGEPLVWTRFKGELERGVQEVPLRFFGKALRDRGIGGPYVVAELRGARYREGVEPNLAAMPPARTRHETRPYRIDEFSPAPWESPKKQATVAKLAALEGTPGAPFIELAAP